MFELEIINLKTNAHFKKVFWNINTKNNFIRKCKYSKKIKIVNTYDYSKFYD